MFNRLYLLNYNNYFNRLVKQEPTLNDYAPYMVASLEATNFNPNDHITTTHIVNIPDDVTPDYAIVTNDENKIVSRWFIIESTRRRGEQYEISLYRDTIVDYYNIIIEAPCFIEKATLSDTDPLIFNQEDFQVNQIKTSETLLKDRSGCAWLVGYLSNEQSIENITVSNEEENKAEYVGEIATWEYYNYSNLATNTLKYQNDYKKLNLTFYFYNRNNQEYYKAKLNMKTGNYELSDSGVAHADRVVTFSDSDYKGWIKNYLTQVYSQLTFTILNTELIPNYIGNITELSGTVIKDSDNKVYSVGVNTLAATATAYKSFASGGSIRILLNNLATQLSGITNTSVNPEVEYSLNQYNLTLTEQKLYNTTFSLAIAKYRTNDIYRMVCIPYPDEGKTFQVTGVMAEDGETEIGTIRITREIAKSIAIGIMNKGGGAGASTLVYDFQLLPFCPIQNQVMWDNVGEGDFIRLENDSPISRGYTAVGNLGIVFEIKEPSFTFNIQHSIPVTNVKVENQCDVWRLCSPNYASIFEFSPAKNGGVSYFNVDCRYKPYQPYIHINPNFNGLYGQDFNDPRGLIFSGDFSLSSKADAFTNYELNNKNYQLMFNRQIQNIEVQNKYQRIGEWAGIIGGGLQGGVTGAGIASMLGAGQGSIGMGITAGLASTGFGVLDYFLNEAMRKENLDYTKDQFGYNLANIQAQPDTLTKVSAFNPNNKIYPVLEYYTCTDREKEAFENKLKYNGMSVGVIGKISDYLLTEPSYIKGQIIRLENLDEETHVANIIAQEIFKGVFI